MLTGIVWYRREDYDRLKALFPDGSKLPDTFEEWLAKAQEVLATLVAADVCVEKAYIDPETFPDWCRTHRHKMDERGRTAYATEFASRKHPPKIL